MTHEPEPGHEELVAGWFEDRGFSVETQVYLSSVRWFCDVVARDGPLALFCEVENGVDTARPGAAQAACYAEAGDGYPLLVLPEDHRPGGGSLGAWRLLVVSRATGVPVSFVSDEGVLSA